MALQEAVKMCAHVAMGDLIGLSHAPEGVEDNYPFNACAWRDWYVTEMPD